MSDFAISVIMMNLRVIKFFEAAEGGGYIVLKNNYPQTFTSAVSLSFRDRAKYIVMKMKTQTSDNTYYFIF